MGSLPVLSLLYQMWSLLCIFVILSFIKLSETVHFLQNGLQKHEHALRSRFIDGLERMTFHSIRLRAPTLEVNFGRFTSLSAESIRMSSSRLLPNLTSALRLCICIHTHIYICMHIYIYTHTHVYMLRTCVYLQKYVHTGMYIQIYIYTKATAMATALLPQLPRSHQDRLQSSHAEVVVVLPQAHRRYTSTT